MTCQFKEDNRGKIPLDGIVETDINRPCVETYLLGQHVLLSTLTGRGAETSKIHDLVHVWEQAGVVLL